MFPYCSLKTCRIVYNTHNTEVYSRYYQKHGNNNNHKRQRYLLIRIAGSYCGSSLHTNMIIVHRVLIHEAFVQWLERRNYHKHYRN